jgi:hypothetical protein
MSLAESMDAAADEVMKSVVIEEPEAPAEPEETPEETPVDTPVDTPDEATEEVAAEVAEEAAEEAVALPEGYVAVPIVQDKLATDFVLRDAEGEVEVPALIVEYKANGKVRKDRLDQVVKLAQFGVYNEERERKVQAVEQTVQTVAQEKEQLAKLLEEREAQLERILQDDEFLLAVRSAYEQQNSPEARAERAEQEARTLRVEREVAPILMQNEQFNEAEVIPALDTIARALPSVTVEELEQRLQLVALANVETAPNGQRYIPTSRFDAIRQYIVEDLAVWAQIQHARRSESQRPSLELVTAQAETDKARIEAQKAKRLVGQATKPIGSANGKVAPKKARVPANLDEAQSMAEREVLAAMGL